MKPVLITKRLKSQIDIIQSLINSSDKITFNRRDSHDYFINYRHYETKPVKHSAVSLFFVESNKGNNKGSIGFSFNYLDENQGHERQIKLPIEKQTVSFSYCVNNNEKINEVKDIVMTQPYNIDEAKNILKVLVLSLKLKTKEKNQSHLSIEDVVDVYNSVFFLGKEIKKTDKRIEFEKTMAEFETEMADPLNAVETHKNDLYSAATELRKKRKTINKIIKDSDEQKIVLELEAKLLKAKTKLNERRAKEEQNHNLKSNIEKYSKLESRWHSIVSETKLQARRAIRKLNLSNFYEKSIQPKLILDPLKKKTK